MLQSLASPFLQRVVRNQLQISFMVIVLSFRLKVLFILAFCTYNLKYKNKISQRLQKAKHALFSLSAQGVHAQGVNPLVSVDLYSKVVIPTALYGPELWNNLTQTNISVISRFQHYATKRIQGLPTSTRSDMAESMVGLNRLPAIIEYRKLMFLHKLMSVPSGSVSRDIFIRKLILFVNDRSRITLGFIPDDCQIWFKYELHDIVTFCHLNIIFLRKSGRLELKMLSLEKRLLVGSTNGGRRGLYVL